MEGIVWYKKVFNYRKKPDKRLFLHFGAVNYLADIFLNGKPIGSHEGGFTPFQVELTMSVLKGANTISDFEFTFEKKDDKLFLKRIGRNDVELEREADNIFHQKYDPAFRQEFITNLKGNIQLTAYKSFALYINQSKKCWK